MKKQKETKKDQKHKKTEEVEEVEVHRNPKLKAERTLRPKG
jgi:hypothetical protein